MNFNYFLFLITQNTFQSNLEPLTWPLLITLYIRHFMHTRDDPDRFCKQFKRTSALQWFSGVGLTTVTELWMENARCRRGLSKGTGLRDPGWPAPGDTHKKKSVLSEMSHGKGAEILHTIQYDPQQLIDCIFA